MANGALGSIGVWRWRIFWCGIALLAALSYLAFVQTGRESLTVPLSWLSAKGPFLPVEDHLHDRADSPEGDSPAIFGTQDGSTLWLSKGGHVFLGSGELTEWVWSDHAPEEARAPHRHLRTGDDGRLADPVADQEGGEGTIPFALRAMAFSRNGDKGVAIGGGGYAIQETSNGGASWTVVSSVSGAPSAALSSLSVPQLLTDVALSDDGARGVAVGTLGVVKVLQSDGNWVPDLLDESFYWMRSVAMSGDGAQVAIAAQTNDPLLTADSTILLSEDGGENWNSIRHAGQILRAVAMSRSGDLVVAVGNQGANAGVLVTRGPPGDDRTTGRWATATWSMEARSVLLRDVAVSSDGAYAIAVGLTAASSTGAKVPGENGSSEPAATGLILRKSGVDGPWEAIAVPDLPPLTSVFLARESAGEGNPALAVVANDGRIFQSTDNGLTWADTTQFYQRAPAPWYLVVAALLVILLAGAGYTVVFNPSSEGAAQALQHDKAVRKLEDDRLDARPLAEGIANFILNPATSPSLTIAITGRWGSGKSSVMGMLVDRLRQNRLRPVEFNAWHYQSEESLLAALLEAIRRQGIPPVWHTIGLVFRCRLFWQRLKRDFRSPRALGLYALAAVLVFTYFAWDLIFERKGLEVVDLGAIASDVLIALGPAAALVFVYRRMGFGRIDGAKLVSAIGGRARIRNIRDKLSIRHRFAEEFEDLTKALRGMSPLVLVIDDLDRCEHEHVVEVLETINFLTTAGECFVVFGMDIGPVLAAVQIRFETIASKLEEIDDTALDGLDSVVLRKDPNRYAREYLEKLINVQAPVSELRPEQIEQLLRGSREKGTDAKRPSISLSALWRRLGVFSKDFLLYLFPITTVTALASILGIYLAYLYTEAPEYVSDLKNLMEMASRSEPTPEDCEQDPTLEGCARKEPEAPTRLPEPTREARPSSPTEAAGLAATGDPAPIATDPVEPGGLAATSDPEEAPDPLIPVEEERIRLLRTGPARFYPGPPELPQLAEDLPREIEPEIIPTEDFEPAVLPAPGIDFAALTAWDRLEATRWVWFLVPPVALLLSVLGFFATRIVRETRPEDSADVTNSLARWGSALRAIAPTARAMKQYQNQIRFMAMRQQAKTDGEGDQIVLPDSMLVALGALKRQSEALVNPEEFDRYIDPNSGRLTDQGRLIELGVPKNAVEAIKVALEEQLTSTEPETDPDAVNMWPPSKEQLELFRDLAADYISFRRPRERPT